MKAAIMAAASGAFGAVCRLFVWRERGAFARAGIVRFLAGAREGGGGGARRRRAEDVGQVGVCNWMIFFLGEILLMSDSEGKQVGGKRRFNEGIVSRSPEGAPLTVSGVESSFEYGTFDRWHPPPPSLGRGDYCHAVQCGHEDVAVAWSEERARGGRAGSHSAAVSLWFGAAFLPSSLLPSVSLGRRWEMPCVTTSLFEKSGH